jgi:hypothetical protein
MHEISLNRRVKDRYATDIPARCFIRNQSLRFEDCTIVNLSRTGAAAHFPPHLRLAPGMDIDCEIVVPGSFEQVHRKATLVWFSPVQHLGGIRFDRMVDEVSFGRLIALR